MTKTLNWGSTGVSESQKSNVASTTNTGWTSTSVGSSKSTYRGFELSLADVCGSENATINQIQITYKIKVNSGTITTRGRVYGTNTYSNNSYTRSNICQCTQSVSTSETILRQTINNGSYSGNTTESSTQTVTATWPWNSEAFVSTATGKKSVEFTINIYNAGYSSKTYTISDIAITIDYTLPYGYVSFDSAFPVLKWKDIGIESGTHLSISNITDTGFRATNIDGNGDAYTNRSPKFKLTEGKTYHFVCAADNGSSYDIYVFDSDISNGNGYANATGAKSNIAPTGTRKREFDFTVRSGYPWIMIRCDVDTLGEYVDFDNFRVYPADEIFRRSTVKKDYRVIKDGVWTFPETPKREGYDFLGWADDNGNYYTASSAFPTTDLVLWSQWAIKTFTITTSAGTGGTITATSTVNYNGSKDIVITPNTGYRIADIQVDGVSLQSFTTDEYTYPFNDVQADHTITATFEVIKYSVTAPAQSNTGHPVNLYVYRINGDSSLTPVATNNLQEGLNYRLRLRIGDSNTTAEGYELTAITVNGVVIPASSLTVTTGTNYIEIVINITAAENIPISSVEMTATETVNFVSVSITRSNGQHVSDSNPAETGENLLITVAVN